MKPHREKICNITPENMIIDKVIEKCSLKKLALHIEKNWRYDGAWVSDKVIFNRNNIRGGV